jgi:hypothetical protein
VDLHIIQRYAGKIFQTGLQRVRQCCAVSRLPLRRVCCHVDVTKRVSKTGGALQLRGDIGSGEHLWLYRNGAGRLAEQLWRAG